MYLGGMKLNSSVRGRIDLASKLARLVISTSLFRLVRADIMMSLWIVGNSGVVVYPDLTCQ